MLDRITRGLTKERIHEDLVLDKGVSIPGEVVQYLKGYQLHGIRFLHQHYARKSSCILNDDKYLGKCFQTVVFLSSIARSNKSTFRCLVVCKSRKKIFNWLYHIELLTDLVCAEFKSSDNFRTNNILLVPVDEIADKDNFFVTKLWDYVIFDETDGNEFTDNDIAVLSRLDTKVKLIIANHDIVRNVRHFKKLLWLLNGHNHTNDVFKRILGKFKKPKINLLYRELLAVYCKTFRLRRYTPEITDKLPLIDSEIFRTSFTNWCTSKGIVRAQASVINSETQINPEAKEFLSQSESTEEMAPLVLDSDTEDECDELRDLLRLRRKSSDVEIFTQKLPSPIILSSENPNQRHSSPDLFESLDEDDSEKTATYDLTGSLFKFKRKLNKEKMSTPIIAGERTSAKQWSSIKQQNSEDLFEGITTLIEEDEDNTNVDYEGKLFDETNRTCVFEITKNDEFPNVIRINSDTEMSPIDNKITNPWSKLSSNTPNSKRDLSAEDHKSNKNFRYFFDHDDNDEDNENVEVVRDEQFNNGDEAICVTPKSSKTPNTSGSSSNRWITKSTSSVKRKLSDSFEKIKSKRLKNHEIVKLQDNKRKGGSEKMSSTTMCTELVADSCSILFKKSKFKRFLSNTLSSSDDEF